MSRKLLCLLAALLLVGAAFAPTAAVAQTTIGYIIIDPTSAGDIEFDIYGYTGSEVSLNPDSNPITTAVTLSDLSLTVGSNVYGPSYFSGPGPDGVSYLGTSELDSILSGVDSATLTGEFSPTTVTLSNSTTENIEEDFTAVITDSTGLSDYDYVNIVATVGGGGGGGTTVIPEPGSFLMVGSGLTALAGIRRRFLTATIRRFARGGF